MTNSSHYRHRAITLSLILTGMGTALYVSLFQLHVLHSVWDPLFPLFGDGSFRVLTSPLSRMLPIPDSLLGALGYLAEAAAVAFGGQKRFGSSPWIVLVFPARRERKQISRSRPEFNRAGQGQVR